MWKSFDYPQNDNILAICLITGKDRVLYKTEYCPRTSVDHSRADYRIYYSRDIHDLMPSVYGHYSCSNKKEWKIATYENALIDCSTQKSSIYTPKLCENRTEAKEIGTLMHMNVHTKEFPNVYIKNMWTGVTRSGMNKNGLYTVKYTQFIWPINSIARY